jgi:uncharacterized protein YdbL (DUF1318 family)
MTRARTTQNRLFFALILAALALATLSPSSRADSPQDALKQKFEQRYPALRTAKDQEKIGETCAGFVEAIEAKYLTDPAIKKLIDDENADRTQLYKMIADDAQTTPDVVATRAGVHNFEEAENNDFLKFADGSWHQKK